MGTGITPSLQEIEESVQVILAPVPKDGSTSPNLGLENEGFRNYADYMQTQQFQEAEEGLLKRVGNRRTALPCAESVYWRCHRRLVSDYLLAQGITVQHIFPSGELRPHRPTPGAKIEDGEVTYPPVQKTLFG